MAKVELTSTKECGSILQNKLACKTRDAAVTKQLPKSGGALCVNKRTTVALKSACKLQADTTKGLALHLLGSDLGSVRFVPSYPSVSLHGTCLLCTILVI
jgi:hypothetical protein